MITVYLNDREASYVELQNLEVEDGWAHGLNLDGRYIHIPASSILYIEDDNDD